MNSNKDYSDNDSLNTIISGDNNNDDGNELEEVSKKLCLKNYFIN
jgi:hypothetical protein